MLWKVISFRVFVWHYRDYMECILDERESSESSGSSVLPPTSSNCCKHPSEPESDSNAHNGQAHHYSSLQSNDYSENIPIC